MILQVNGSTGTTSSNEALLKAIKSQFPKYDLRASIDLGSLPLFVARDDHSPYHENVQQWKTQVRNASAVLICTPAYLENMPASLKSALEWLKTSGELDGKAVLPITFSPHPPRGERAMQSMIWTLQALNARIVGRLSLFGTELSINADEMLSGDESIDLLREALLMLTGQEEG